MSAPTLEANVPATGHAVLVVKYGGAAMVDGALADSWARDMVRLQRSGTRLVVVHGGGPALTRALARMGIETTFVDGQRVTSAETAEVAEMVLSGRVNGEVVSRLNRVGGRAVGLSGTDAGWIRVRPHRPGGRDIGFVADVEDLDTTLLTLLLDHGYIPVLSSTASDSLGCRWNINADLVAGAVASKMRAAGLVYLSDVPGVLVAGAPVPSLTESEARTLLGEGKASGGMRPKLEAALAALASGVPRVYLSDGRMPHAVLGVIVEGNGKGTLLIRDGEGDPAISPGWTGTLEERGAACVLPTYARYPMEIASGCGSRVTDSSGRVYLDFVAGIAVNVLGHGHPNLVEALRSAAPGLIHVSNLYWTEPMVRLAERLTQAAGMERAFFCNSGAESVEAALKLARKARPGRAKVVVFERSFHGRTLGALSVTAQPHYQEGFHPLLPGIEVIPFGDFGAASTAIDETTSAVLVEPIQGEGGVRPAPPGWLGHLRAMCDRVGALLILDEVQCGVGRTGTLYAYQGEGVLPDVVASAKALAGGLPMGALLARGDAARAFGPGQHASTFGGGPLVATLANAVLDVVLADGFLAGVRSKGEHLGRGLERLAGKHALAGGARGRGLMWGLVLNGPHAPALVQALHHLGMLTVPAGKNVLRFVPPLVIGRDEIDEGLGLLDRALAEVTSRATAEEGRA